jgi:cytochrome c oxidase assembly protein subunit 11
MSDERQAAPISTGSLTVRLLILTVAMFAFGFLLVPLYDAFCEVTGFGGKTNSVAATGISVAADESRTVNLEFVTTVNAYAPWEFRAAEAGMTIHPGGLYEATFYARNLTDRYKIAQAVPSVAPLQAARYFKKLDCFCFTAQEFEPGEEKEMLVRFIVESELPDYIDTVTLSYTFFDTARHTNDAVVTDNSVDMAYPLHSSR